MSSSRKQYVITYVIFCVVIFLMTFMFSGEYYFVRVIKGKSINFWKEFIWNLSRAIPYIVQFPIVIWLANRFPLERPLWLKRGSLHIFFSVCFSLIHSGFYFFYNEIHMFGSTKVIWTFKNIVFNIVNTMVFNIMIYWVILAIGLLIAYNRRNREFELKTSQMETLLAQNQLQILKMQLHPHFFFNTLHTISALINKNPKAADRMISRLSELLRLSLDTSSLQEIPFKQELEYLEIYLDIEKTRFNDRLKIKLSIDPKTKDIMVPNLILQPLVENAIRHGIGSSKKAGRLIIQSALEKYHLKIVIEDNGKGFRNIGKIGSANGIGIANTKERLKQLYGDDYRLKLENVKSGGACVTLLIPIHTLH